MQNFPFFSTSPILTNQNSEQRAWVHEPMNHHSCPQPGWVHTAAQYDQVLPSLILHKELTVNSDYL